MKNIFTSENARYLSGAIWKQNLPLNISFILTDVGV